MLKRSQKHTRVIAKPIGLKQSSVFYSGLPRRLRWLAMAFSFFCLLTLSPTLLANNSPLSHIAHKIASIKHLLHRDTNKREQLQKDLEKEETHSGEISKHLNTTKKELEEQKTLLVNLKLNEDKYQNNLKIQKDLLRKQIQAAYMLGREPYLKLLLNQENGSEVSRILMYYHYINQNRIQEIQGIQETLKKIQENQEAIKSQYQILQSLQTKQNTQKEQLDNAQKNRKRLLFILNKNIQTRQERLNTLIANKQQLENTIERVGQRSLHFPKLNFSKLHKRLSWPTKGQVLRIFGTKINQSELRWGGVLIRAPEGQPVHAIAKGKVVFAKWLSGYGLLLIVNHGNGYMTLYGRNHALYKNVGDIIHRGDLIATVGQTGGYQKPALYFAVRHNGKPINPALFISKEAK